MIFYCQKKNHKPMHVFFQYFFIEKKVSYLCCLVFSQFSFVEKSCCEAKKGWNLFRSIFLFVFQTMPEFKNMIWMLVDLSKASTLIILANNLIVKLFFHEMKNPEFSSKIVSGSNRTYFWILKLIISKIFWEKGYRYFKVMLCFRVFFDIEKNGRRNREMVYLVISEMKDACIINFSQKRSWWRNKLEEVSVF